MEFSIPAETHRLGVLRESRFMKPGVLDSVIDQGKCILHNHFVVGNTTI